MRGNRKLNGLRKNFYGRVIHSFVENIIKYTIEEKTFTIFFSSLREIDTQALINYLITISIKENEKELRKYNKRIQESLKEEIYTFVINWFSKNRTQLGKFLKRNIFKDRLNRYKVETERKFILHSQRVEILDYGLTIKTIHTQTIIEPDILILNKNLDKDIKIIEIKFQLKNDNKFKKKLTRQVISYFELLNNFNFFKDYKVKEVFIYEIKNNRFIKVDKNFKKRGLKF